MVGQDTTAPAKGTTGPVHLDVETGCGRLEVEVGGSGPRARYRQSFSQPVRLRPGRVYEFRIELGGVAVLVARDHRLRLDVSSSNFPRFDRNSNTGGDVAEVALARMLDATIEVFHDRGRASHLLVPTGAGLPLRDW